MKADEIVRALRDAEGNNELDCEISELRPLLLKAADLIESLQAKNKALLREVCNLACESVEREKNLARLEAEIMARLEEHHEAN